ncbi:response regulator transcription factor [Paenibacillus psychroresistens]|uniref:response regulator transcription factor n=1 Tax=Paenibacillus psychroresistens TaxID=1778678 RepID=UPI001D03DDB7|nr:response regulator transcription factor [Paenibacillus psychroresistens]
MLIVDDEPNIRDGLRTLIPWGQYGFQVMDVAANGNEAIIMHQSIVPDLMIVDIRMPGMNGLELIQKLRESDPRVQFLILSGYADFQYAQKAIQANVHAYILKPIDETELIGCLVDIAETLDLEAENRRTEVDHKVWEREHRVQWALANLHSKDIDAQAFSDLKWDSYQILLVKLNSEHALEAELDAQMKQELKFRVDTADSGIFFTVDTYLGVLLKDSLKAVRQSLLAYDDLAKIIHPYGIPFSAAVGMAVNSFEAIKSSYDAAAQLIKRQFFLEDNQIFNENTKPYQSRISQQIVSAEALDLDETSDLLYYAMDIGSVDAAEQILSETLHHMLQTELTEQEIKSGFVRILSNLLGKISLHNAKLQSETPLYMERIIAIYPVSTLKELQLYMGRLISQMNLQAEQFDSDMLLKKMVDLIRRNCHENLKLETLAKVFNYNSAYLGKIFKSYTGEYFNTFLDQARMEKAKELLGEGLKVYQVAERIGYTNVDYFHSKFRNVIGISPTAYRKSIVKEID